MSKEKEQKGYITLSAKRKDFGITKSVEFSFNGIGEIEKIIDLLKTELNEVKNHG